MLIILTLLWPGATTSAAAGALSAEEMAAGSEIPFIPVPTGQENRGSALPPLLFRTQSTPFSSLSEVAQQRNYTIIVREASSLPIWNPVATSAWARRMAQRLPFDELLIAFSSPQLERLVKDDALRHRLRGLIVELAAHGVAIGLVFNNPVLFLTPERGQILAYITALQDLPLSSLLLEFERVLPSGTEVNLPLSDALVNLAVGVTARSPWPVGISLFPDQLDQGELGSRLEKTDLDHVALRLEDTDPEVVHRIEPLLAIYAEYRFKIIVPAEGSFASPPSGVTGRRGLEQTAARWRGRLGVYPNFSGIVVDDLESFERLSQ